MIPLLLLLLTVPLPNATVIVSPGGTVITDEQGQYKIELTKPWTGTINATYPGCMMVPAVVTLSAQVTDYNELTFTCQDVQSPTVAITFPKNNGTINKAALLRADVSDNIAVVRVIWSLDGKAIGTVTAAPWSLPYQFGRLTAWHMLTATTYDSSGNSSTSSVRFRIK